jgi:hypothetical protein
MLSDTSHGCAVEGNGVPKISNKVIYSKEREIISRIIEHCDEDNVLIHPTE